MTKIANIQQARGKMTVVDWSVLKTLPTQKTIYVCISERDAALISAGLVPLRWMTRYLNIDDDLELPDMIDQIEATILSEDYCCDAVAWCLSNSPIVKEALDDLLKRENYGQTGEDLASQITELASCDQDTWFGAITSLVDYLESETQELFARLEVATNVGELVAEWLDEVPLVAIGVEYVNWVQDSIKENFDAAYTDTLRDEFRCDLFCIATEQCSLSAQDVYTYFADRLNLDVTDLIGDAVNFLTTGTWTGDQIPSAMFAGIMAFMVGEGAQVGWFSIPNLQKFKITLALGANDPDSDWALLCDPCGNLWCQYWLSNANASGMTINIGNQIGSSPALALQTTSGIRFFDNQPIPNIIDLEWSFSSTRINNITVELSGIQTKCNMIAYQTQDGTTWTSTDVQQPSNGVVQMNVSRTCVGVRLITWRDNNDQYQVDRVEINGEGVNPFGLNEGKECE